MVPYLPLGYYEGAGRALGATAGGALGAGAGQLGRSAPKEESSLLDLLAPLDYPRQALWNMVDKGIHGDLMGALPGLIGTGVGAGLMATGLGAPLGGALLGGALAGGLAQGAGKALSKMTTTDENGTETPLVDPSHFEAKTGSDLVKMLGGDPESFPGMVAGMGLQMAGDPLSWVGMGTGGAAGAKEGAKLRSAAEWMGPGYSQDPAKLTRIFEQARPKIFNPDVMAAGPGSRAMDLAHMHWSDLNQHVNDILQNPNIGQILSEIPDDARYLGNGAETIALGNGKQVYALSRPSPRMIHHPDVAANINEYFAPPPPTMDIPEMYPSLRSKAFNAPALAPGEIPAMDSSLRMLPEVEAAKLNAGTIPAGDAETEQLLQGFNKVIPTQGAPTRVEVRPMLTTQGNAPPELRQLWDGGIASLRDSIDGKTLATPAGDANLAFVDSHHGNVGLTPQGRFVVMDPGAVVNKIARGEYATVPGMESLNPVQTNSAENALLKLLGSDRAVRADIAARAADPALLADRGVLPFIKSDINPLTGSTLPFDEIRGLVGDKTGVAQALSEYQAQLGQLQAANAPIPRDLPQAIEVLQRELAALTGTGRPITPIENPRQLASASAITGR